MRLPKITVVTPSYNQGEFLEETLSSVLSQQYPRLELIVIDGGSTDGSVRILKKYSAQLSHWVSEADNGQSHAINKGLRRATGDILTWVCSDDLLKPNALRAAAAYFQENPNHGVVHGGCAMLKKDGQETKTTYGAGKGRLEDPFLYMAFPQPASFFRRTLLEKVGFLDESLHYAMDYDLFARFRLYTDFLSVKDIFGSYRLHEASKTVSQHDKFREEYREVFSRVLRSFEMEEERQILIRLGEYRAGAAMYEVPDAETWTPAFRQHLSAYWMAHQMRLYFGEKNFAQVLAIGDELQHYAPSYWTDTPELHRLREAARYEEASLPERIALRARNLLRTPPQ